MRRTRLASVALCAIAAGAMLAPPALAQDAGIEVEDGTVQLDFNDVELSVVIDTIARLTGKNFIYDDRVRGRVTIVSPTRIPIEEAYTVFESVLQVKGFTTVVGPGEAIKVIPIREAKENNVETIQGARPGPKSDRYVTRLIPLRFIDADAITNTLKPLVSKDASMVAYPPTNTVILTDASTNISRILQILRSIDVETYKEELTVIHVRHADAATLAGQISDIFGAEGGASAPASATRGRAIRRTSAQAQTAAVAAKGQVRILTDERTNSLIILASRQRTAELREVIERLDVPVRGGGRIHVYYLRHADAEELAQTLQSLISGQPAAGGGTPRGGVPQQAQAALRAAVTELSEGVTVTADAPTNSLVIQASKEGYSTLAGVIDQLDIARPQVLVEALIMEVDVSDSQDLGFSGVARIFNGKTDYTIGSITDTASASALFSGFRTAGQVATGSTTATDSTSSPGDVIGNLADTALSGFVAAMTHNTLNFEDVAAPTEADPNATERVFTGGTLISGIIRASARDGGTNILSAPYILTSDNEEAEIKVGANIPIVTSRVQSAQGVTESSSLATSQNIERRDIGITLRVTPQISEGDILRLKIFQEITDINGALSVITGDPQEVGVSLSSRTVENTVVVADDETVVIGGILSDDYEDSVNKVPWLGDIPVLGWAFKSTSTSLKKTNLLIFLTPHIVRSANELEFQTIRKREEFWDRSKSALELSDKEKKEHAKKRAEAAAAGVEFEETGGRNPVRSRLLGHQKRYPVERMAELEAGISAGRAEQQANAEAEAMRTYRVLAATYRDEHAAETMLQDLVDAGIEGTLVSGDVDGEIVYELQLGPFDEFDAAENAAGVAREAFGLTPSVSVEEAAP